MTRRVSLLAVASVLLCVGASNAQAPPHPVMDMIAKSVVQKYQTSSCQDIARDRSRTPQQHTEIEQRVVQELRSNPGLRVQFINQVAAPIANRLFECGMLP